MENKKSINTKRLLGVLLKKKKCLWTTITGFSLIFVAVVSMVTDPVSQLTKYCMRIDNGTYIYNKLQEKFESITIKMYLFNVTNSERFIAGLDDKLKLQEIGPFTYKELRMNVDLELDNEKKVLRYTPNSSLVFVPEQSVADPKDVIVYTPNLIYMMLVSWLATTSPWMSSTLLWPLGKPTPIWTLTAEQLILGYKDPLVEIGKIFIPGIVFFDKAGLLAYAFDKKRNVRYEVDTTYENMFQIKKLNGSTGLSKLGYDVKKTECNSFDYAYEGIMFPANTNPSSKIKLYNKVFCRLLEMEYVRDRSTREGYEAYEFRFSNDSLEQSNKTACYCPTKRCFRGIWDISSCIERLPVAMSNGHFLYADERAFDRLEGLHPDESIHGNSFLIHKTIGLPVQSQLSVQINIIMGDMKMFPAIRPFSNMLLPVAWAKVDQLPLPSDIAALIKFLTVYLPAVCIVVQVALVLGGVILLVYTLRLTYRSSCKDLPMMQYSTPSAEKQSESSTETPLIRWNLSSQPYSPQCR